MTAERSISIELTKQEFRSEQEQIESVRLTEVQQSHITNLLRDCIMEKVNISAEVDGYLLKQEYMRGQIEILMYILALDTNARAPLTSET